MFSHSVYQLALNHYIRGVLREKPTEYRALRCQGIHENANLTSVQKTIDHVPCEGILPIAFNEVPLISSSLVAFQNALVDLVDWTTEAASLPENQVVRSLNEFPSVCRVYHSLTSEAT